ncbi:MAG: hypothetical protein GY759_14050 [Chloroflexi bacterium]|nr:hypothetical protein [Chloroflexota bacterium]
MSVTMEEAVIAFGEEEQARLAEGMSAKQITVCQDETFHPQVCLVAIEPVSNFLLLEKYADDRKGKTWTEAMAAATSSLPIEIIQSTSDEGRGLLRHVKEDLGIHHSPDQFHVQYELSKASSGALSSRKRQAEKAMTASGQEVSRQQAQKESYYSRRHGPGRAPDFDKRSEHA